MIRKLPALLLLLVFVTGPAFAQGLSGDYHIGAAGTAPDDADPDYATLHDAFADLTENGADGPVTFLITTDLDESDSDLLLSSVGLTAETPLTIRPAEGTKPTVTMGALEVQNGPAGAASFGIVNTGYVTIDGSAEVGGDSRDLTWLHESFTPSRAISIAGDSPNVIVRNNIINIDFPRGGTVGVRYSNSGGMVPVNGVIENNQIGAEGASYLHAIALFGVQGTETVDEVIINTDIINNDLWGSQRVISTWVPGNARYEGNRLHLTGQFISTGFQTGMYIVLSTNLHIAGNEFMGAVTNNATFLPTTGIVFNANVGDTYVYNNFFAVPNFTNQGAAEDSEYIAIGVNHAGGTGSHYIYNNTIRLGSSDLNGIVAAFGASVTISGLERIVGSDQSWELRNNIISIDHDADNAYAIYWPVTGGTETENEHGGLDSDYNNLYVPDGIIALLDGTTYGTLADWEFGTPFDGNSISKEVEFVSGSDLRLTGDSVGDRDLRGVPSELVTTDIDGTERDATYPYMGAYEGSIGLPIEGEVRELAEAFVLHQNYPNPFNPSTSISYTLRDAGHVRIQVYNAIGQLVEVLVDGHLSSGRHDVSFNAEDLASGMYIYRMEVDNRAETRQMMLVK